MVFKLNKIKQGDNHKFLVGKYKKTSLVYGSMGSYNESTKTLSDSLSGLLGFLSFQGRGIKLPRFLSTNQHSEKKLQVAPY